MCQSKEDELSELIRSQGEEIPLLCQTSPVFCQGGQGEIIVKDPEHDVRDFMAHFLGWPENSENEEE